MTLASFPDALLPLRYRDKPCAPSRTCTFCGKADKTHRARIHCLHYARQVEQFGPPESWVEPLCEYEFCREKPKHLTRACLDIVRLCSSCGMRGHDGDLCEQFTTDAFRLAFEAVADKNMLARRRHKVKDWGFYGPLVLASGLEEVVCGKLTMWLEKSDSYRQMNPAELRKLIISETWK